ncbi:MAG: YbgA family protein, partial [Gammaproteobacteria bacterium]
DSPSCGMERVKVYTDKGMPGGRGAGAYAQEIMAALPLLPVEEEGRLGDPVLRENFIQRVFVYDRWQRLIEAGLTPGALVDFHTRHKFILLAHDEPTYREIGHWIADAGKTDINALGERYISALMTALKKKASRKRHTNVLMHLMGFLKQNLDADDKAELVETIEAYRQEQVPLVVPITLLRHHFRRHPDPYVQDQYYLDPHPRELKLRNML